MKAINYSLLAGREWGLTNPGGMAYHALLLQKNHFK
jgi:hypothetical protein